MTNRDSHYFLLYRNIAQWGAILFVVLSVSGCNGSKKSSDSNADSATDWQSQDALSAGEIVANMREVYASAQSYRDEAILSLSYRLQGRFLDEPHQWGVEFQRPNQLRASVYNARMRSDGAKMGCFVYDFGSGNLGDQWQVHNVGSNLPIGRFFQDGICRHYLTGQTDLPVDRQNPKVADMFFPPTVGLLTGQTRIDWLDRGVLVRKPDRKTDADVQYLIDVTCDDLVYQLAIDSGSFLVSEIRYPVKALDGRLLTSPDVENLEIVARFKGATTTHAFEEGHFFLDMPLESISVNHFVAVPEAFPSPAIAKSIAALGLLDLRGALVNQADWKGKVTLLAWSSDGLLDESWSSVFEQLSSELSVREYHIATVNVIPQSLPGDSGMKDAISKIRPQKVMANYADPGFEGGKVLGVEEWPFYAVIDRDGVLQYVFTNQRDTPTVHGVRSVLMRVRSGDDVAAEMRSEYEKFLDEYQVRLAAARTGAAGNAVKSGVLADASLPAIVKARELWSSSDLVQPGNIVLIDSKQEQLLVVDGWRTIARINANGEVVGRDEVQLPPRESINVVRKSMTSNLFVVYSIAGRHVYVIDGHNKALFRVLDSAGADRIRDARLADLDRDGIDELYVAWTGERGTESYRPDETASSMRSFAKVGWRDSAIMTDRESRQKMIVCDQDAQLKLVALDSSGAAELSVINTELDSAVRVQMTGIPGDDGSACVIGTDGRGEWKAVLLNHQLEQIAIVAIGPQQFDTQIEPIAYARTNGAKSGYWGIAGSDGSVTFISDDGQLIDRWNTGHAIDGIAMFATATSVAVVTSSEQKVTAWTLTPDQQD